MLFTCKPTLRWVAPFLLVALSGCGGADVTKVTGTLKYKGQPVPNAIVDFSPANGRPSYGETDEQGHFKLIYDRQHDGAVPGKHKVSVRKKATTVAEKEAEMAGKKPAMSAEMSAFFEKYSGEKSTYEVTIDKSTSDITLDLP
jgi:hypothetical protein